LTDAGGGEQPPVVCEVLRRGRLLVAEPFFEQAAPLTLGRKGAVAASEGELVAVRPLGGGRAQLLEVLGRPADLAAVLHGLAVERGAARPWPDAVEQELAGLPSDPLEPEAERVDLRDRLVFTIDPETARDFDDAIGVEREPGGLRVFVHIADVARFVTPGAALDAEATRRGTSAYLPGRVEPMLPGRLSNGLCSLQPGLDRYAVTIEIAPDGELRAYRSLIRSRHRLTYDQVERILAGDEHAPAPLEQALRLADGHARALREARFARGAARIETGEPVFSFAEGRVTDARIEAESPSHALVEEFMLLANTRVAELLAAARAPTLYRVHAAPQGASIERLAERLAALDVPTPPMPPLEAPSAAAAYAARLADAVSRYCAASGRGTVAFPGMVLRALERARYDARNLGHSGLATSAYCHFTSPIRRYPDLVCHRALLGHLGLAEMPATDPVELGELAVHCSQTEREADLLERRGDDICLAWLLEHVLHDRGWDASFAGEVVGLIEAGAFVRFGDVFEGMLPVRVVGPEWFDLDRLEVALVGRSSGRRLRLGDAVDVRVSGIDRVRGRVDLRPG
jgi:ribonuclease R